MTAEARARQTIDALLMQAGWQVCNMSDAYIHAACGVALREFPLNIGYGFADYLLYLDDKAAGVIEAKKEGATLTGVEVQSARYAQSLPASLTAWVRPLPFSYESTGLPPLAEPVRIVSEVDRRLTLVRSVQAEVDANLKRAQALRQAALQQAFED